MRGRNRNRKKGRDNWKNKGKKLWRDKQENKREELWRRDVWEASEEDQTAEVEVDTEKDIGEASEAEVEEIGQDPKVMTDTDVSAVLKWAIGPETVPETIEDSPETEEKDQKAGADKRETTDQTVETGTENKGMKREEDLGTEKVGKTETEVAAL